MSIRLTKPWIPLARFEPEVFPAQLGVFQLGDASSSVIYIGYGGGREPFGLRTAIVAATVACANGDWGPAVGLRYEVTHGYMSRWQELLMIHQHDFGALPIGNPEGDRPSGRLNPVGSPVDSGTSDNTSN